MGAVFPLGHAFLPLGLIYALQQRGRLVAWDLRLVALGGLLPDLLDKPLTLWVVEGVRHGHWVGHTVLFAALLALLAVRVALARPLALGVGSHALLDRLPLTEPAAWLWPALGPFPAGGWGEPVAALLTPWFVAGEALGFAVLLVIVVREGLLDPARLLAFLRTGDGAPAAVADE